MFHIIVSSLATMMRMNSNIIIHNIFDKEQTKLIIRLWRPYVFAINHDVYYDKLSSDTFIKARLFMEEKNTFSIVSMYEDSVNVFLCQREDNCHNIKYSLWNTETHQEFIKYDLKKWHNNLFDMYQLKI
jgi:hypothetical protein